MAAPEGLKALIFDVFGTCVDLHAGLVRGVEQAIARHRATVDPAAFAIAWRAEYQPGVERVRTGQRPFVVLDTIIRESLDTLLPRFGLAGLSAEERAELAGSWRRLDPWPGVVDGLARLKSRFIVAPHSNGSFAMLVGMAKHGHLPWDCILGAELVQCYKPMPASYTGAAALLGLAPGEVMMVAGHNGDLRAAQAQGLRTGFVVRPLERRPGASPEFEPTGEWDIVVQDFGSLADQLGA